MAYGNLKADVIQSDTTGTPPQFKDGNGTQIGTLCRAWVNFNGTGTVAIRASFNVSSITDNGTGNYTVNFTTAMSDANFVAVCGDASSGSVGTINYTGCIAKTTTTAQVVTNATDLSLIDFAFLR